MYEKGFLMSSDMEQDSFQCCGIVSLFQIWPALCGWTYRLQHELVHLRVRPRCFHLQWQKPALRCWSHFATLFSWTPVLTVVKQPKSEADNLASSVTKTKNMWNCVSTPYVFVLLRQGANLHFKECGTLLESHVTYNN